MPLASESLKSSEGALCILCEARYESVYTLCGELAFCDSCYSKVCKVVSNFVALKQASRHSSVVSYIDAKAALESTLRRNLKK